MERALAPLVALFLVNGNAPLPYETANFQSAESFPHRPFQIILRIVALYPDAPLIKTLIVLYRWIKAPNPPTPEFPFG